MKLKKLTLLFGRICSGKSSYKPDEYRIVVSNIVKGIISKSTREELQDTLHLDQKIGEALVMVIDQVAEHVENVIVDGIRQASIVEMVLQHYPFPELVWLEVPVQERKRRYESRKDAKDVEPFDIADNKQIELECQKIFTIFNQRLKVIDNYEVATES
jgi:hypothetical protein